MEPTQYSVKTRVLEQCRRNGATVTALRAQVLDIVLSMSGVIKAYQVLAQMQRHSDTPVAPPTAYRALDFWAEHGVLHKVSAVNGYILCSHIQHDCSIHCHEEHGHANAFVLVCTRCGAVDEQGMSREWTALRQRLAATGFALNEAHIVLTGICATCQQQP